MYLDIYILTYIYTCIYIYREYEVAFTECNVTDISTLSILSTLLLRQEDMNIKSEITINIFDIIKTNKESYMEMVVMNILDSNLYVNVLLNHAKWLLYSNLYGCMNVLDTSTYDENAMDEISYIDVTEKSSNTVQSMLISLIPYSLYPAAEILHTLLTPQKGTFLFMHLYLCVPVYVYTNIWIYADMYR
jgi:hypothetical protein